MPDAVEIRAAQAGEVDEGCVSPRRYWRRFRNQDREFSEVLGSGGEVELVSRSIRTAVIYSPTIGPRIHTAVYCGGVRLLRGMVPWEQMAVLGG